MPRKPKPEQPYAYPAWEAPLDIDSRLMQQAAQLAALPRETFTAWLSDKSAVEVVLALRLRFRFDRMWFLTYCWPDVFKLPFNPYHVSTLASPKAYWRHRCPRKTYRSVAAPRGIAKTTTAKGDLIHDIVYGLEGMVVVHSAGLKEGSEPFVKDIAEFINSSRPLAELYGPSRAWKDGEFLLTRVGQGPTIPVFARSFKTQVRGTNFRAQRPTKYIIDDGEHPDRVRNPDNRKADANFLREDIAACGPKEGGLIIDMRGTMLHPDSLLMSTAHDPAWQHEHWRAILSWPTNEQLWDQAKAIWMDLTNPNGADDARAFYEANKEAMDEGAEVLDPVAEPLFSLYEQMWAMGRAAFMKEKQNEVVGVGTTFFDMDAIDWYDLEQDAQGRLWVKHVTPTGKTHRAPVDEMQKVMYLDPIPADDLGGIAAEGAGASDYAALAVVGRYGGYAYVLDVWMDRARDDAQILAMYEKGAQWGVRKAFIEPAGFGRMVTRDFSRLKVERRMRGEFADIRLEQAAKDSTYIPKNERIATLQVPLNHTKWLLLGRHLDPLVVKQLREFPEGSHDDAPDAIAGAYNELGGSAAPTRGIGVQVG